MSSFKLVHRKQQLGIQRLRDKDKSGFLMKDLKLIAPLQRILHAAARLVYDLKPRDHVTSALKELYWLPVKQRIEFKLCLLVHDASIGHYPTVCATVSSLARLRASSGGDYVVPTTNRTSAVNAFFVATPQSWNRLPRDNK